MHNSLLLLGSFGVVCVGFFCVLGSHEKSSRDAVDWRGYDGVLVSFNLSKSINGGVSNILYTDFNFKGILDPSY